MVGKFVAVFFTMVVSLYYAITNAVPILPQWTWGAIFGFMVLVGVSDLEEVVYYGLDDDEEDEEEDWEEDDDDEWED